jgi:hypothetical protein
VSKSRDHAQQQHGRHHRGQVARFGITRTTQTVSALACAAVMALVGTASLAQARPDGGGGGVRVTSAARAYPSSPGRCPLERVGDQLVRCDNLTGAGAVAPPWVPEQAGALGRARRAVTNNTGEVHRLRRPRAVPGQEQSGERLP